MQKHIYKFPRFLTIILENPKIHVFPKICDLQTC